MATGISALQRAVKKASEGGQRGVRGFNYFKLDDGEELVFRFLTDADDIVTCDFYEYVKTRVKDKEGKMIDGTNSFIVAPSYYADNPDENPEDWVLKYGGKVIDYNTKELVDPKPKERGVAIVVERERVAIPTEGKGRPKFKHQDKLVEVTYKDKDGNEKKTLGRNFILIRKDSKTFWNNVINYHSEFETFCDRDYKVSRSGTGLGTNYPCIPVGPEEEWEDIEAGVKELQARYGYGGVNPETGNEVGKDDEDRFLYCPMTLSEWCEDQAREDRVKTAILGVDQTSSNGTVPSSSNGSSSAASNGHKAQDEAQAASSPGSGDVADLRRRLEAHQ